MTAWQPDLSDAAGPKYRVIADTIAADIVNGRLKAGDRLPPQRDLAWKLGVTVGTVSRAYQEAERRGLVGGEVGRGTYVRGQQAPRETFGVEKATIYGSHHQIGAHNEGPIDLKLIVPVSPERGDALRKVLREMADAPDVTDLMNYGPESGLARHRNAAAQWLARVGLTPAADDMYITNGAMHAVMLAAMALSRPGDSVAVEALTYPGFRYLAEQSQLRMRPLAMDEDGILPGAFEAACREERLSFLYTIPTLQNPTARVMPAARREAIAEIAARYGVPVIEDDVYGFLPAERPAPIAELIPDLGFYCMGGAKTLAAGLRVGFLRAPRRWREGVLAGMRISTWMASTLGIEAVSRWIADGTAERLTEWHREQAAARQRQAMEILGDFEISTHPNGYHLWMQLPPGMRSDEVVLAAERRGVLVTGAEHFVAGRGTVPRAIRVCLAAEGDPARLRHGLETVADVLCHPAAISEGII